jgi:hypothetical protein
MKKTIKKKLKKSQPKETAAVPDPALPKWNNLDEKKRVFQEIIGDILLDHKLGQLYVENDHEARQAFVKKINVPANFKIVFLRAGDSTTPNGGSAIIEVPPADISAMSPDEKLELFVCTYNPW